VGRGWRNIRLATPANPYAPNLRRGIGAAEESSSEEEGSGDEGGDLELAIGEDQPVELDPAEWGIGAAAGNPDVDATLLELSEATARLAVVDLEWRRMRAVDILAVLQSFLPKGGAVRRVTVYVSDYGRAAMERERVDGPQGLRSEAAAEVGVGRVNGKGCGRSDAEKGVQAGAAHA